MCFYVVLPRAGTRNRNAIKISVLLHTTMSVRQRGRKKEFNKNMRKRENIILLLMVCPRQGMTSYCCIFPQCLSKLIIKCNSYLFFFQYHYTCSNLARHSWVYFLHIFTFLHILTFLLPPRDYAINGLYFHHC